MEETCKHKNPLVRGGTSQPQRILKTLQKDYVQIDEHNYADLILFAKNFSQHLYYYNTNNHQSGSWGEFFSTDVSVLIAFIADNDIREFDLAFQELLKEAEDDIAGLGLDLTTLPTKLPGYKKLFDFIFSLAHLLDEQIHRLPNRSGLKAFSEATILQNCSTPFKNILGFYKVGIEGKGGAYQIIDNGQTNAFAPQANLPQKYVQQIVTQGLSVDWVADGKLNDVYAGLNAADFHFAFGTNAPSPPDVPNAPVIALHVDQWVRPSLKAIESVYQSLSKVFLKIVAESLNYLEETLEEWRDHAPHMSLYLSFLKLFRFAQNHLNSLKEEHVNFYYKEVLRLQERPAQPDQVFAIIELAKQVEDFLLENDIAFKAGKDSEGNQLIYKSTEETAINKASVAQLKSVYKKGGKIYASPVTNSEDGLGEPLSSEDGSWKPFGLDSSALESEIGFAIASPNLFLKGGLRTVKIILTLSSGSVPGGSFSGDPLKILLTGEEEWIEKEHYGNVIVSGNQIKFSCQLSADDPKVVPYNSELHGGTFHTNAPIVKVLLKNGGSNVYQLLKDVKISNARTEVVVNGLKDIIVQNDSGRLDLSNPVLPFGGTVKVGASMIVGSKEVFQKEIVGSVALNIGWEGLSDLENIYLPNTKLVEVGSSKFGKSNKETVSFLKTTKGTSTSQESTNPKDNKTYYFDEDITVQYHALLGNTWTQKGYHNIIDKKLSDPEPSIDLSNIASPKLIGFDYSEDESYTPISKSGFVKVSLLDSFGQKEYHRAHTLALIELAKENGDLVNVEDTQFKTGLKDPPYIPSFKELSLDYTAASTFNLGTSNSFDNRAEQFFHLHPFGQKEQHSVLGSGIPYLLPQFSNSGDLMIGIKDLRPQQSVSVLFQIAEGTANPLKEKQEVQWSYLYNNTWVRFSETNDANYNDQTNGLLQSGLITFFLPKEINTDNTWLETNHVWIKASVVDDTDAICNIIDIKAQAVRLQFEDQENAEDVLSNPLAPKQIKKLLEPTANIKKIEQPYTSFGGKVKEQESHFHKRVSERLRHKGRAISIWDYEHLVLEEFPEIYRVKCLNHTQLKEVLVESDADGATASQKIVKVVNGIAPGHVIIVTVPDLQNKNAVATLKPFTNLNTLSKISDFIKKRTTPHAKVEVMNPVFEEIQLDFQVQFRENIDFTLFEKTLNEDILKFLSPWAFQSEEQQELEFGGKMYKSVLLDYIEELYYVDFVTEFRMNHITESKTHQDIEEAEATTSRSILVSVPQHTINKVENNCI